MMSIDLKHLIFAAIVGFAAYYIYSQNTLIDSQKAIMEDQYNLIGTQRAYIIEINKMLGINAEVYWYRPQQTEEESPINLPPI